MNPTEYGVPHDSWRQHQKEAIDHIISSQGHYIVAAPTGSGKTAIATAFVHDNGRGIALTKTKILQQENYANGYGFYPLFGRGNYGCAHDPAVSAAHCAFSSDMTQCPQYSSCEYVMHRDNAKANDKATLNFAYWMHVFRKWPEVNTLVCDEAHQLPDIVLEWAGCTVTDEDRRTWGFPVFPVIRSSGRTSKNPFADKEEVTTSSEQRAAEWLEVCLNTLSVRLPALLSGLSSKEGKILRRKAELLHKKLTSTVEALSSVQDDWYIRSGPKALSNGKWGFIAKPLTARHHFPIYFVKGDRRILMMSATIGNPEIFAEELGIEAGYYEIPSAYGSARKPVHALDVPRIGRNSKESDYVKQAIEIARFVKKCPPNWEGIVHTNSKSAAHALCERLARQGLQDRLWSPEPGMSTDKTIRLWHRQMKQHPGSIIVTWNLHEGYDGTREKICISAKVPYPYLGDPYEKARQNRDGKMYFQRAAWGMEQMMGRVRRGEEDFDTRDEMRAATAIADGSWNWVKKYFSGHFRESIVT